MRNVCSDSYHWTVRVHETASCMYVVFCHQPRRHLYSSNNKQSHSSASRHLSSQRPHNTNVAAVPSQTLRPTFSPVVSQRLGAERLRVDTSLSETLMNSQELSVSFVRGFVSGRDTSLRTFQCLASSPANHWITLKPI